MRFDKRALHARCSRAACQAAQVVIVHLLFNLLGVLFLAFVIPQYADFIRHISPSAPELTGTARLAAETPRQVANAHTVFSVFYTVVLIWFTKPIGSAFARRACLVPSLREAERPDKAV